MSRYGLLIITLVIINVQPGFAQENPDIKKIRSTFQKWQPFIDRETVNHAQLYKYVWGNDQQYYKWTKENLESDSLTLVETASILENKDLGTFVLINQSTSSGDWYIVAEYYYNKSGGLYFIFWRMNTFYAEIPLSIEKRGYFDENGRLIRNLKTVYKMNTKEKVDISFMDKPVDYKLNLSDLEFYKYWKLGK